MREGAKIILVQEGKLLLLLRTADAPRDPSTWTFPGGGKLPGETACENAVRECAEEIGWAPHDAEHLGAFENAEARIEIFLARLSISPERIVLGEESASGLFTPEEAARLPMGALAKHCLSLYIESTKRL